MLSKLRAEECKKWGREYSFIFGVDFVYVLLGSSILVEAVSYQKKQ